MKNFFKLKYLSILSLLIFAICNGEKKKDFIEIQLLLHCNYEPYQGGEVTIFKYKWYKQDEAITYGVTNLFGIVTLKVYKEIVKNELLYIYIEDQCNIWKRKNYIFKRKTFIKPSCFKNIFSLKSNPINDKLFAVIPLRDELIFGPFEYHLVSKKVEII
uniref:Lipoprotein n=1 Tax=Strongyloides stercoralis TaxID=6248 RepID=A0A0K0EME5_STRER